MAAEFSGGDGIIDENGINLNGIKYALRQYAQSLDGAIKRYSRMEMINLAGRDAPALSLTFTDANTGAEKILNGGFESGDFTNWMADTPSKWTFTSPGRVGTWFPYYTGTVAGYEKLTTDRIACQAESAYLFSLQLFLTAASTTSSGVME